MIKPFKRIILLSTLLISTVSLAQDSTTVSDFELWAGVSLKKSFLDKKLDFRLDQEFRFDDNSTSINNYFTELSVKYEVLDGLEVGSGFRFVRNNLKSGYRNERRFIGDVRYKHKVDRLSFAYRFRFQNHTALGSVSDDDVVNKIRLRAKVKYNIKNWKLDPYFSMEGFYAFETNNINYVDEITESEKADGFEKLRFTIGTSYKVNKWFQIGGFYRIEHELKSYHFAYNTARNFYIAGLNLTFKL